ncbi:4Fe-4S single cluster domain-containing protein [Sinomonas atrocyanea]|uniref:4Fe-4S single cluster domain-containing protein n=1 Tax=Sinomonas atrocyanea TaxID=37927 RepID=UPI003D95F335
MAAIRVSRILHATTAEGPGLRTAVWFQGCSIRCKGCINPHLFSELGGFDMDPEKVVGEAVSHGVEGLTFLGGEPFDQAAAAGNLARLAQQAGLGVVCFSGYQHEDLAVRPDADELLKCTDLLVDGPYRADEPEAIRALVGSTNQRFINLTSRYADFDPVRTANRLEMRVAADGSVEVAGFLQRPELQDLTARVGASRVWRRNSA